MTETGSFGLSTCLSGETFLHQLSQQSMGPCTHASTQSGHKRNLEHTMKPRQRTVNNKGKRRRSADERTWKCTRL